MTNTKKHTFYYFSLILLLLIEGIVMYSVSPNRQLQRNVLIVSSFIYVIYGMLHHKMHHDIHAKVVIEYALVAMLGIALVLFFLSGGHSL